MRWNISPYYRWVLRGEVCEVREARLFPRDGQAPVAGRPASGSGAGGPAVEKGGNTSWKHREVLFLSYSTS